MADLARWFARADELAAAGKYFDAHEELEAPWKSSSGLEKSALQGVIQIAAGLHRLRENPSKPDGAFYLFERGLQKLENARIVLEPASLARLKDAVAAIRSKRTAPASFRFGLRAVSG